MISSSAAYNAAINGYSRVFRGRFLLDGAPLACEIKKINIVKGACGSEYTPGSVFIPYIEADLMDCEEVLKGRELKLQIGILLGYSPDGSEEIEYISIGQFTVDDCRKTTSGLTLSAVGRLTSKCSGLYESGLTFPATIRAVVNDIAAQTGVPVIFRSLDISGLMLVKKPEGLLYREVLGYIAGVIGGYVTEDSNGNIVITTFSDEGAIGVNGDRSLSLPEFTETNFSITGVKVVVTDDVQNEEGETIEGISFSYGDGSLVLKNPFMTAELFQVMQENLQGTIYHPGKLPLSLGDPRLEPWDCLLVEDLNGEKFILPCLSISHTFDGGLSSDIEAPGDTDPGSQSSPKGPVTQQVERMHSLLLTANEAILKRLTVEQADIKYAAIGEFNAIKGKVETLETNSLTAGKADLLYAKIGELTALKGKFDELETKSLTAEKADLLYAKIGELTALSGKFDTLSSKAITAEYLEANYTKTVNLEATYAKIQQLEAVSGRFGDISADKTVTEYLEANYTDMKTFTALKGVVDDLNANKITTGYLEANYASLSALNATVADIGALKANKVDVSKANIDEAWIKDLLVKGKFLANDINAATGSFSHYLTGVNIVGDNITGGTISTERLIIRDKDGKTGILFELNNGIIDQTGLTEEELKKHALNGQIIVAQSITADKINVTDLFAQDIMATGSITGMKMLSTYIEAEAGRIGVFGIDNIGLHSETSGLVARYDGTSPYMVYADPVRIHEQTTFVVTQPLDARVFARCRYKAETIEFSNVPQQVKLQSGEGAYITSVTKLKIKLIRLNDNYAGAYDVTENWNDVDTVLPNTTKVEFGWEICATGQRYYNDKNTGYVHDEPIYWYADLPNATNEDYTLRLLWSFFRPQLEVYAVPADVGIFPHELRYGDFRVNSLGEAYGMTAEVGNVSSLLATTEFVKNAMTWNNLQDKPSSFVPSAHTHDDRYFTETEMNSKLAAYAQTGHTHDDRYFTESEVNNLLSGKQNNLGFTPIQQGGGKNQKNNKIYIGWTDSKLNAQVDVTDFGALAFESWVSGNYSAKGHKHSAVDITGGALKVSEVNITAARSAQAFKIIDSSNAKNYLAAYLHNNNVAAVLGYYKDGAEANFISLRNDDTRFGKPVAVGSGGTGQNHVSDTFECAAVNTSNVEISNQTCKYFPYLGLVMIRLTVYVHDISVGAEEFFSVVQVPSKYTNNSFIPLATATGTAPLVESMIYPENHASHARLIRLKCNKAWKLGYFYIQGAYLL